jgi:Site-specific DNA methylase
MADGSRAFNFPPPQVSRLRPGEIVIDLFAGGGGASEALKQALGIDPALAYNHDEWAIGMHAANHPLTIHHREDIWHADPRRDVAGRPVGWFHASPDCTHFSQAKGGQPRSRKTRALSWVVLKWVGQLAKVGLAPRIISLENVWQILTWGPLVAKRDRATGRVLKMDGTVAAPGERVPVENQQLVPDKRHAGRTWRQFVAALRAYGYQVEWRKLRACDYGAGTSRERLFLIARRDGEPIRWPEPTHGPGRAQPYVPAAASIDFSDLGRSIFDRPKPLADATLRRIARGVVRHVLQAQEPFFLTEFANASAGRIWSASEPLRTQCAGVKGGHFALVSAFLEQACGGYYEGAGQDLRQPTPTICAKGSIQRLVSVELSPDQRAGADRVAAFLVNYYGNGTALDLREPLDTVTTRDRMALVTVMVRGTPYVITDIRLRMLKPAELFRAQGFPPDYIIDRTADGRPISGTHAVRMVGNSVSPPPLRALAEANLEPAMAIREAA